ncbi:MAG: NUDIX domain-containing protein [bacterium]
MQKLQEYLEPGVPYTPAVVCYLRRGNEVLLGLRKKVSFGLGENLIAGIGGKVGDQSEFQEETPDEALVREVSEEIGVVVTNFRRVGQVKFVFPHKPKWSQYVVVYVVDEWVGEPHETDAIRPMWFDVTELPVARMWDDNKYWLPKVLAGECVNATFLFDESSKVCEHLFQS